MLKEINLENLEERLILTTVNQTWFKFLAVISFTCAIIIYVAVVWLLVCRSRRLQQTDDEIKRNCVNRLKQNKLKKKKLNLRKKLRYLFIGSLKSPSNSSIFSRSCSTYEHNEKAKSNKSKYKRRDSKFKDLQAINLN